jgi:S-adenosylmethionine synthetase
MDYKTAVVISAIDKQSHDIAQSVHLDKDELDIGAGDQGLMMGYATDETEELMPLSHHFCSLLIRRIEQCKKEKIVPWMRPDAKVQVSV